MPVFLVKYPHMMAYLQEMRGGQLPVVPRRRVGCLVFGWIMLGFLAVFLAFFAYRFAGYSRKIRSGNLVELPQYGGRMTTVGSGTVARSLAQDSELMSGVDAAYGAAAGQAKLTIVEFGDFSCPFSKDVAMPLRSLVERHKDQIRLVYRHYPLEVLHPGVAMSSAEAAACAGAQGQFWLMYDKLYLNQQALKFNDLLRYAGELNLDQAAFEKCMTGGDFRSQIESDFRAAEGLGLVGTPSFYFNGQLVSGAIPSDILEKMVEVYLK
jgi:protein-disulfide isomerase